MLGNSPLMRDVETWTMNNQSESLANVDIHRWYFMQTKTWKFGNTQMVFHESKNLEIWIYIDGIS